MTTDELLARLESYVDEMDAFRRDRTTAELTAALGRVAGDILRLARRVDELAAVVSELTRDVAELQKTKWQAMPKRKVKNKAGKKRRAAGAE